MLTDLADGRCTAAFGVRQVLQVNARAAGPRLGSRSSPRSRPASRGDWSVDEDGAVIAGGIALLEGEYTLQTVVADADPDDQRAVAMLPGGGFVILDTAVTPELAAEGLARDVVRAVQQARRDAGLEVSDRIALTLGGEADGRGGAHARRPDRGRDPGRRRQVFAEQPLGPTPSTSATSSAWPSRSRGPDAVVGPVEMAAVRRRVVVTGRVQGVFFRDSTAGRRAGGGSPAGYHRADGSVEAVFEGEPDAVDAWSRGRGAVRPGAGGRHAVTEEEPTGEAGFAVV